MTDSPKWRYCPACGEWKKVLDFVCPACEGKMTMGRVSREKPERVPPEGVMPLAKAPPVDPRVVKPVANREVKPR